MANTKADYLSLLDSVTDVSRAKVIAEELVAKIRGDNSSGASEQKQSARVDRSKNECNSAGDAGTTQQDTGAEASVPPLSYSGSESAYAETFTPSPDAAVVDALAFDNAGDFLAFVDPEIAEGRATLYKWQYDELDKLSNPAHCKDTPDECAIVAANGSGKDKYIIAPFAVWMLCCKVKARVIITTSSGTQLSSQTEPYIKQLCQHVNSLHGPDFIKIRQRHITCDKTGSEIRMFATDEGGRAEGYHPWESNTLMAIIVNEAKSVDPDIFAALNRCTGYSHNLMISSPGQPSGNFYKYFTSGLARTRKITAFMCPHIPKGTIEKTRILYGEGSALYRSMIMAEFTSVGIQVVITPEVYDECLKKAVEIESLRLTLGLRAGLDLATIGDETVFSVFRGNKQIGLDCFQCPDTTDAVDILIVLFTKWGFSKATASDINADDGGVGKGIIDQLHKKGWYVNRVLNQSAAIFTKEYGNKGAEMYFNFQRLVDEKLVVLLPDEQQREQMTTRKYKQSEALGKIVLQSKKEAKAEGVHSPDRADATVLVFHGKNIEDFRVSAGSDKNTKDYPYDSGNARNNIPLIEPQSPQATVVFSPTSPYLPVETRQGRCYGLLCNLDIV